MSKSKKKLRRQLNAANKKVREQKHSMDSTYTSPSGGYYNPDNGFGPDTDPTFSSLWLPPYEFTFIELTNLYQNPLMKRIVDLHAQDGTRKGFELVSKEKTDLARDLQQEMEERFNWVALGTKMIAIRHLYGGGVLFADIDDGRDPEEPLNENNVRKLWSFQPVENFYAYPITARPLFQDEKPGQPMHYNITIQAFAQSSSFKCHESRLIRFPSYESDDVIAQSERVKRRTWPFSTTQLVYDGIKRYGIGMQSESQLLQGFVEDVFKVSNLKSMKDHEGFRTFLREQRLLRNSLRATVIGENDDLQKVVTPTQGLSDITQDQRRDVGMISGIPVPIIFSEESGALGGSTLSESRKVWFDTVESKQVNQYTPLFQRMLYLRSLEDKTDIDDIGFSWNPLETMSPAEQAELELKVAEKDKIYVESLGMPEADILEARFGSGEFSPATPDFDKDAFEKEMEEQDALELEHSEREFELMSQKNAPVEQPPTKEVAISSNDEKQPITIVNVPQAGVDKDEFRTLKTQIANIKPTDLKPVHDTLEKIQDTVDTIESKEEKKQTFELEFEQNE